MIADDDRRIESSRGLAVSNSISADVWVLNEAAFPLSLDFYFRVSRDVGMRLESRHDLVRDFLIIQITGKLRIIVRSVLDWYRHKSLRGNVGMRRESRFVCHRIYVM